MNQSNAMPACGDAPEQRHNARKKIELQARFGAAGDPSTVIVIRNISQTGCLLDARGLAVGGDALVLVLPGLDQPIGLDIVHGDGAYLGVHFRVPLEEAYLAQLLETHSGARMRLL